LSNRKLSFYIQDVLESIQKIQSYIDGLDFSSFESSDMAVDAVIRNFEIMGEAVKRIPDEIRSKFPNIKWKSIVGLRNVVLHDYLGIDKTIIFNLASDLEK